MRISYLSSNVCSSDLLPQSRAASSEQSSASSPSVRSSTRFDLENIHHVCLQVEHEGGPPVPDPQAEAVLQALQGLQVRVTARRIFGHRPKRSEERRVGKERVSTCSSRWSTYHSKK